MNYDYSIPELGRYRPLMASPQFNTPNLGSGGFSDVKMGNVMIGSQGGFARPTSGGNISQSPIGGGYGGGYGNSQSGRVSLAQPMGGVDTNNIGWSGLGGGVNTGLISGATAAPYQYPSFPTQQLPGPSPLPTLPITGGFGDPGGGWDNPGIDPMQRSRRGGGRWAQSKRRKRDDPADPGVDNDYGDANTEDELTDDMNNQGDSGNWDSEGNGPGTHQIGSGNSSNWRGEFSYLSGEYWVPEWNQYVGGTGAFTPFERTPKDWSPGYDANGTWIPSDVILPQGWTENGFWANGPSILNY